METIGTYTPDNLLAGHYPLVTQAVTIATGNTLVRGTVLGQVTATGLCQAVNSAATDGSETPYAILAEDVDAALEDRPGAAYMTGEFNENALIFGGTDTADTHRAACRALSIYFRTPVSA